MTTNKKKGRPREPRCTDQQKTARLLHVVDLLCDGLGLRDICKDKSVRAWGVDRIQVNRYIKEAWVEIHAYRLEKMETKIDKAIVERDRLKLRAMVKKDYHTALRAMDSRDKIEGVLKDREPAMVFSFNHDNLPAETKKRLERELGHFFGKRKK